MQITFHSTLDDIDAAAWDALRGDDNPFVSHAFLAGLERHGCIRDDYGWHPHHLAIRDHGQLIAAAPLYLKGNSHGEFVFDHAWARAYAHHGLDYYPKLLAAVPYSPVTGPRLLAGSGDSAQPRRERLIAAMTAETQRLGLSSAHLNFAGAADLPALAQSGWLARSDWQFHWRNRGWRDFDDFLAALTPKKRKNIRQERAAVLRHGVSCEIVDGDALTAADWQILHELYVTTMLEHGNTPVLTLEFLHHLGHTLGRSVLAVMCRRGEQVIAGALFLRSATTLYGRYWGMFETVPGLHFEACYYQGIEYCLREGLSAFEPGAQGEHKVARGFLPMRTHSFHWIADPRFRTAIAAALADEEAMLKDYAADVRAHSPYSIAP